MIFITTFVVWLRRATIRRHKYTMKYVTIEMVPWMGNFKRMVTVKFEGITKEELESYRKEYTEVYDHSASKKADVQLLMACLHAYNKALFNNDHEGGDTYHVEQMEMCGIYKKTSKGYKRVQ